MMKKEREYYYGQYVFDTAIRVIHANQQIGYGAWGHQIVNQAGELVGFEGEDPSDSYGMQIDGMRKKREE